MRQSIIGRSFLMETRKQNRVGGMTRNLIILRAVALGYPLRQVGEIFDISVNRVRQIAIRAVAHFDKKLWREVGRGGLSVIREHKDELLEMIAGERTVTYKGGI